MTEYHQIRVSPEPAINSELSVDARLANIEHDIVGFANVMNELMTQNKKYTRYLDIRIQSEIDSAQFWVDVRKRLAVAGIIGVTSIVGTAVLFTISYWLKNR